MVSQVKTLNTTKLNTKLDVDGLTEVALDGNGVLDRFLRLQRKVLDREFNEGRIQGKEYADSFIATYTINMELAIKFLLEKEKQYYDIELVESQIRKSEADTAISNKELEIMTAKMPHEIRLIEATANKMETDALIAEKSLEVIIAKLPLELSLMEAQITKMAADTDIALKQLEILIAKLPLEISLMTAQVEKMQADVLLAGKQIELASKDLLLKQAQIDNASKDLELKEYELSVIKPQEFAIKAAQLAISEKELLLKAKQIELAEYELLNKLPAEVAGILANNSLVGQKEVTEKAQTDSTVIGTKSVIDWNVKVLEAQIKGIDQEAKQKIMRLLIDTWTTRVNNDSAGDPSLAGLGDSVILSAVTTAKASAGIP